MRAGKSVLRRKISRSWLHIFYILAGCAAIEGHPHRVTGHACAECPTCCTVCVQREVTVIIMAKESPKPGSKHRLLVYRFAARRYRPAGVLLIVIGIIAVLPYFIPLLRFPTQLLTYNQLAILGAASIIFGLVLFIIAVLLERQAYVQCLADYMVVHTLMHHVAVAYQRVNNIQPVQVGRVFDIKSIKKDREKLLIKPLLAEPAVEVELKDWPVAEKRLRRSFSRFLFSTRENGFIFIVQKPQALSLDLSTYQQRALDTRDADQQRYLDPIERLKYQNNKTF